MGYPNGHGQSNAAMAELGWKTLKERRLQSKARLVYKITHGMAPTVLIELFSTSSMIRPHDHNLRNFNMNLYIPFPKTDYLKKCISYNGAKLWNELPSEIKNAESLAHFNSLIHATSLL